MPRKTEPLNPDAMWVWSITGNAKTPWPTWINEPLGANGRLAQGTRPTLDTFSALGSGFPEDIERPKIELSLPAFHDAKEAARVPELVTLDFKRPYLMSARVKQLCESIDPEAFEFVQADMFDARGLPGPEYWVADIVRVISAIDLESAKYTTGFHGERKVDSLIPQPFLRSAIGDGAIFYEANIWHLYFTTRLAAPLKALKLRYVTILEDGHIQ